MVDATVRQESAEKIAPVLPRMCLTIGRENVAVDQSEIQSLISYVENYVSPLVHFI
jgi:hypothetical protein